MLHCFIFHVYTENKVRVQALCATSSRDVGAMAAASSGSRQLHSSLAVLSQGGHVYLYNNFPLCLLHTQLTRSGYRALHLLSRWFSCHLLRCERCCRQVLFGGLREAPLVVSASCAIQQSCTRRDFNPLFELREEVTCSPSEARVMLSE